MSVLPPLTDFPTSLDPSDHSLPSHNSQPDLPTHPHFSLGPTPIMKRNSSAREAFRRSSLAPGPPKKRASAVPFGTASPYGRFYKILGDFYLLSGRTEDASTWYTKAVQILQSSSDPVWQACALEGLATIVVIDAWSSGQGLVRTSYQSPFTSLH
jgi:trafficking protein particle complex subunit 9